MQVKKSTATKIPIFMTSSVDHVSGVTGLSAGLTITIAKNNGDFEVITPTVTEPKVANGWYWLAITTELDTACPTIFHITGPGCDPTDFVVDVVDNLAADIPILVWNVAYDAMAWATKAWANVILGLQTILNKFGFTARGANWDVNANVENTVTLVDSDNNQKIIAEAFKVRDSSDLTKSDGSLIQELEDRMPAPGPVTLDDSNVNKLIVASAMKDQDVSLIPPVTGSVYDDLDDDLETVISDLETPTTGLISLVNTIKGYLDTANTGLIAVVGAIRGFISDLWIMRGLDASNPKTIDKVAKTESAGGIVLDIDETDPTKTIVTREP